MTLLLRRNIGNARQPDRRGRAFGLSSEGFHELSYTEWGPRDASRVVICVHGLTRQGRDFDYLAAALAHRSRRVVCPDLVGRGRSGWLASTAGYVLAQYCADMGTIIAATGATEVDWVGTSLGGMIGMVLAAYPNSPIRRLVVNDIGPTVPAMAALQIGQRLLGTPTSFVSLEDAERHFRTNHPGYGLTEDTHWAHVTRNSVEWCEQSGAYRLLFDRKIVRAYFLYSPMITPLWRQWETFAGDILIVRGSNSDVLPSALVREMTGRNARATAVEMPGVGHMPMFMDNAQIQPVVDFLAKD
jgi:pimeloyl-ACP methyl ester carboxylesterase